jgi:hypothetical protein
MNCPKCNFAITVATDDCPNCGIIMSRWKPPRPRAQVVQQPSALGTPVAASQATFPPAKTDAKKKFWGPIDTIEDADKVCRDSANAFFFVAILQGAIGAFFAPAMLIDAAAFAILAFLLRKLKSRVAAVLLLIVAGFVCISTVMNKINPESAVGGSNIFLAIIIMMAAIRAVQGSFKYHSLRAGTVSAVAVPGQV